MKYLFLILMHVLLLQKTWAMIFTINGKINNDKITNLSIHKWNNMFDLEFIANIPIHNNEFIYVNTQISEVDIFVLTNSENNQAFKFVWDGEVDIIINSLDEFYLSKIYKSPLSDEFFYFNEFIYDSLFAPIKRLDTLIIEIKKVYPNGCDSLNNLYKLRIESEKFARQNQIPFMLNYVREHPESFISVYILTKTGMEFIREDYQKYFLLLADELKSHSRLLPYFK